MSAATRAASTDEQEEAIQQVEKWAKEIWFHLSFGTTIGKSPQTVILDHKHQDNSVYVDDDGEIKVYGFVVKNLAEFKKAIADNPYPDKKE